MGGNASELVAAHQRLHVVPGFLDFIRPLRDLAFHHLLVRSQCAGSRRDSLPPPRLYRLAVSLLLPASLSFHSLSVGSIEVSPLRDTPIDPIQQ